MCDGGDLVSSLQLKMGRVRVDALHQHQPLYAIFATGLSTGKSTSDRTWEVEGEHLMPSLWEADKMMGAPVSREPGLGLFMQALMRSQPGNETTDANISGTKLECAFQLPQGPPGPQTAEFSSDVASENCEGKIVPRGSLGGGKKESRR